MSDDPTADFLRHDAENQRWLDTLPKCHACGEPISDYFCLYDEEGNQYHRDDDCVDAWVEAMIPFSTGWTMEQ